MTFLTPYALPAVVALLAKAGMYFYARYSKVHNLQTQLYLLFLFSLSIQNLAEIASFAAHEEGMTSPPSGLLYFSAGILAIAFLLHLALVMGRNSSGGENLPLPRIILLYIPALVLEVLLWFSPLVVAGFEPMGYTYTKVPGSLYFLFQLYATTYLCGAAAALLYGAKRHPSIFRRQQNKLLLLGLFPFVALAVTIIALQQFGFRGFNSTVTLPLAITFFLAISAYATHQYRLLDIEFFIPWSKVRQRKTAFYKRIQAIVAEIAQLPTVNKILQSLSETLHCPVVLVGGPKPAIAMAGDAFTAARFPREALKKIDHIIVANEIVEADADMFALMKRHKVAAVVPFHPHSEAAASWMLLGEAFSEHVYTPLDFKVVESLFDRLADHFLDKQLLLRSQLSEAQREMHLLQERLATAWEQLEGARKRQRELEKENHRLQRKGAQFLRHELSEVELELMDEALTGKKTLDEYGAEFEARMIEKVLQHCEGDRNRAAQRLGLTPYALHHKMVRYGLEGAKGK
jgi:DNA-binding protein Fis